MHTQRHSAPRLVAVLALAAGILLSAPALRADEVLMRDGSRLLGEVLKRDNGVLEFRTSYAGTLNIEWSEIAEIRTDKPMEFLLTDNSTVMVKRVINNTDDLIVENESEEQQTLAQEAIELINPEPWKKGEGYNLTGRVNFAFQRERGNTDKDELEVDGDLIWRRKHDRFTAFGEYERDRSNNKKTKDKWKLEGSYNYFVTKQWYWGGFGRLEHDKFADLELRTSVGPLIGYQWFESKKMNLRTTTGLSYVNEDFIEDSDNDYVALPWAVNFDRFIFGEFAQFYHKQVGFWNLEDTGDVVWDTWTGLRFPLILGLVASTEIKVEYNSGAADDAKEVDTTYNLKLGYQW